MDAVFASLNKGENVTSGLKKVDDAQKVHKNPELRSSASVSSSATMTGGSSSGSKAPPKPPKPASYQKKPPKMELDRNKWIIVREGLLCSHMS
jgi:adenylyl cyclase-associated protein